MNAMLDLAHFYDQMIQLDPKYYQDFKLDIMPLLDIVRNLFNGIKTKNKLIMFYNFYQVGLTILSNSKRRFSLLTTFSLK